MRYLAEKNSYYYNSNTNFEIITSIFVGFTILIHAVSIFGYHQIKSELVMDRNN